MENEYVYALVISQLSRRFECCINKALGETNLTQSQLRVLLCICENEARGGEVLFQKDIERILMLSNPAVTGIVQRLESKGLIERKTAFSDCRHKEIHSTEESRRLAAQLLELKRSHEAMLLDGISPEEREVLYRCLDRMLRNCIKFEAELGERDCAEERTENDL